MFMALTVSAMAAGKINVLIIDGQNNHNWKATTPVIQDILEKTGHFNVTVLTSPPREAPAEAWALFRPDFAKYKVIFSNYNGADWPVDVQKSFESYMAHGGGLVIYHAANNPFPNWVEWNKMVGLSWQGPDFGDRITVDDNGEVIRTPKGQGPGAGHGPQHPYDVVVRDPKSPIMKGLPLTWLHTSDELYHGQRGPAVNMHILATAYSDKDKGGTGANEPMVYVISYGKGRVFVDLMGHDVPQTSAPDSATLLARGTEWAATGKVTIPVSPDFPGLVKK
jgi:type 1 glutamine amidotransferase